MAGAIDERMSWWSRRYDDKRNTSTRFAGRAEIGRHARGEPSRRLQGSAMRPYSLILTLALCASVGPLPATPRREAPSPTVTSSHRTSRLTLTWVPSSRANPRVTASWTRPGTTPASTATWPTPPRSSSRNGLGNIMGAEGGPQNVWIVELGAKGEPATATAGS